MHRGPKAYLRYSVVNMATTAYFLSLRWLYLEAGRRVAPTSHDSMKAFLLSLVLGCNIKL